ncbi:putative PHD type zinc finger protein with BAH domain-containing protein [Thecaphora frezii]
MQPSSNGTSPAPSSRSAAPVTTVAIRNGKTIGINDHIYISAPWAPGAGEAYVVARVMEFVTAASSRSGAAALASSSGTLQVRANVFLRMRDISLRNSNDPRLLVATMHSDVFNLDNVRGICNVRHRDLIGSAPDVSQWKKKEDHFYYYQLYDRYIHRFYDVIPTEKVKNAPPEVLSTLRTRYSFVVSEIGMMADLCDALRGCAVCHRWAASVESVRCDTCKKFFHMKCLNPPLASKPAKGYSWTCAPCSKRHEQDVGHALATGGTIASNGNGDANGQGLVRAAASAAVRGRGASLTAGRGRGRGGALSARRALRGQEDTGLSDHSPDGSPAPEKTIDDIRGTRCFNRWPYRYFGQHTHAPDVLDPHDSVYPIATTRLGVKYQAILPSWEEQKAAGLGVHFRAKGTGKDEDGNGEEGAETAASRAPAARRRGGRPGKRKRGGIAEATDRSNSPTTGANTPTTLPTPMPSEPPEFERGTDQSVQPIFLPSVVQEERTLNAYMKAAKLPIRNVPGYNVDLLNRALVVLTEKKGQPVPALQALSQSKPEDLRIVSWSAKELKQFDTAMKECSSDMRQLKKRIPTKKYSDIVRHFVVWKTERIREDLEAQAQAAAAPDGQGSGEAKGSSRSSPSRPSASRAVSPSLSVFGDEATPAPARSCSMCSTVSSEVWYKGPVSWTNRALCINCGLYWRKYAAEAHNPELVSINTRNKSSSAANVAAAVTATAAEENGVLGVAPFIKPGKAKEAGKAGAAGTGVAAANGSVSSSSSASASTAAPVALPRPKFDPLPCVLCRQMEPQQKLAQCRSCSLSVHTACFGLDEAELEKAVAGQWYCEACENEETLDAALVPHCILCSKRAQQEALEVSLRRAAAGAGVGAAATVAGGGAEKPAAPEKPRGRGRPSLESKAAAKAAAAAAAVAAASSASSAGSAGTAATTSAGATTLNGGGAASSAAALAKLLQAISAPLGPLDAFKPTECNNWVHVVCALFTPEVVFSDAPRLKTVEGCGNLPPWRYEATCSVCDERAGSCIMCAEAGCKRVFHASCAVNHDDEFVVGFEVAPPMGTGKGRKAAAAGVESVTFQGETGVMSAVVYCRQHRQGGAQPSKASGGGKGGRLFGIAEMNTTPSPPPPPPAKSAEAASASTSTSTSAARDEVRAAPPAKTALQVYAETYKHIGAVVTGQGSSNAAASIVANMTESSYALLRRAKRFDLLSSSSSSPSSSLSASAASGVGVNKGRRLASSTPATAVAGGEWKVNIGIAANEAETQKCCRCGTGTSPFWWDVPRKRQEGEAKMEEDEEEDALKQEVCCTSCRAVCCDGLGGEGGVDS